MVKRALGLFCFLILFFSIYDIYDFLEVYAFDVFPKIADIIFDAQSVPALGAP